MPRRHWDEPRPDCECHHIRDGRPWLDHRRGWPTKSGARLYTFEPYTFDLEDAALLVENVLRPLGLRAELSGSFGYCPGATALVVIARTDVDIDTCLPPEGPA